MSRLPTCSPLSFVRTGLALAVVSLVIGALSASVPARADETEPRLLSADGWELLPAFEAAGTLTIFNDKGEVRTLNLEIRHTPSTTGAVRSFHVKSGPCGGDTYTVTSTGTGPLAPRERRYFSARKNRETVLDESDADDGFCDSMLTYRELDGGFAPWSDIELMTRAHVDGIPALTFAAAPADPKKNRRLGSWSITVREADGQLAKRVRLDKKGRIVRELRGGNVSAVQGRGFVHKWEIRNLKGDGRVVLNIDTVRFPGLPETAAPPDTTDAPPAEPETGDHP